MLFRSSCGKCRVKLVSGEVTGVQTGHISDEDYAAGWRLSCSTKPAGDITVLVPDIASAYQSRMKTADLSSGEEIAIFNQLQQDVQAAGVEQLNQLKKDVQAITEAIASYKEQISKLEGKNKSQSAEFKRLIAGLNAELDQRTQKLNEITKQLAEKNQQLAVKTEEVANLTENVEALDKANKSQQMTINEQDMAIHQGHYLIGNRKELKEAEVISRQGIFCPPIVSSQAQKADFTDLDIREMKIGRAHV